ncbi:hypothetical protein M2D63_025820, partial [Pseudomonas sp. BJa5]|uniref:hypothetical protein n=1 Tax=Pseudomonas sp. BJa5 TaxID=2936270 RepID=UPI002559A880
MLSIASGATPAFRAMTPDPMSGKHSAEAPFRGPEIDDCAPTSNAARASKNLRSDGDVQLAGQGFNLVSDRAGGQVQQIG